MIIFVSTFITSFYKISPEAALYARNIMIVMGCCMWIRATNMIAIIGVIRSGGDTRFGFLLDAGTVWGIGVPSAFLGAFVLHLSIYWVVLMVMSEELVKMFIALWRIRSRRWLRDLTQTAETGIGG